MQTKGNNRQKTLQLQKRIFRSLKAEAELLLGGTPDSIKTYEREYKNDFSQRKSFHTLAKSDLISEVQSTDVTFIADFHTFDQAQRTALRVIREAIQPGENWLIGLEFIPSHFQTALDNFQSGKISLEFFHEQISYSKEWGFPWQNYAPIFEWAKDHQIRLIALNRPQQLFCDNDHKELPERDRWAAGIISDIFHSYQHQGQSVRMIVLYGELHLGSKHLPLQLKKISKNFLKQPLQWICIHQNEDRVYWKLAKEDRELSTEVVRLKKNIFCLISSTPWAKLQSLVNWIEGGTNDSPEHDYLSTIQTYGKTLAEFLKTPPPSYEDLSACSINQMVPLDQIYKNSLFSKKEISLIRFHISHNLRLYIPRIGVGYLGSPSHNGAAELAAIHLLRTKTGSLAIFSQKDPDDFFRLILEFTFGFFGSLILNPRRKCDLPNDHIQRLRTLAQGQRPAYPREFETRQGVVRILRRPHRLKSGATQFLSALKHPPSCMLRSRLLGYIFGKKLHQAMLDENIPVEFIKNIFLTPFDWTSHFYEIRYQTLIQKIAQIQIAPSKLDHF